MSRVGRDLVNGVVEDVHIDDSGQVHQVHTQDITQILEDNKRKRNETNDWMKFDPKQNLQQVLDLSMTDCVRIKNEHGIDILGNDVDWRYVFKLIETHYPYMKTTTARL